MRDLRSETYRRRVLRHPVRGGLRVSLVEIPSTQGHDDDGSVD